MLPNIIPTVPLVCILFIISIYTQSYKPAEIHDHKKTYDPPKIIKYVNTDFLKSWTKIETSGKQNCGIYISDLDRRRLIKCVPIGIKNKHNTDKLYDLSNQRKLYMLPMIYNIYVKKNKNIYIEMERMDGTIKQLIYETIPKMIIENMQVDKKTQDDIWSVYTEMSPFFNQHHKKFWWHDKKRQLNKLKSSELTHDIYNAFMQRNIQYINEILPQLRNQITMIHIQLYYLGYRHNDSHLNNYAYMLSDTNEEYMGRIWKGNKVINGKYLKVYLIDFDSIKNFESKTQNEIVKYYNEFITIHEIHEIGVRLHKHKGLPSEILRIINTEYKLPRIDINMNCTSIDEIIRYINNYA